jgi:hypothetical protein
VQSHPIAGIEVAKAQGKPESFRKSIIMDRKQILVASVSHFPLLFLFFSSRFVIFALFVLWSFSIKLH